MRSLLVLLLRASCETMKCLLHLGMMLIHSFVRHFASFFILEKLLLHLSVIVVLVSVGQFVVWFFFEEMLLH